MRCIRAGQRTLLLRPAHPHRDRQRIRRHGGGGWTEAGYSFTYRILDQDGLTVAERDAFLQSILKGMQDGWEDLSTESLRDEGKLKQTLQAELDRLGAAAATGQIAYTGGAVEGCWSEAAYDGSGTLVTHDLVMEGMA